MVTVRRFGSVRLKVLSGDQLPPHFHVDTPEGELSVDLETGDVTGGKAAKRSGKQALEWAEEDRDSLKKTWEDLNK